MKKIAIAVIVVIMLMVSTISFAGTFEVEGTTLKPIQTKLIKSMIKNAGIDLNKADVMISVEKSKELSKQMNISIVFAKVTILIGDQILESRLGLSEEMTFDAIERSVSKATEKFVKK